MQVTSFTTQYNDIILQDIEAGGKFKATHAHFQNTADAVAQTDIANVTNAKKFPIANVLGNTALSETILRIAVDSPTFFEFNRIYFTNSDDKILYVVDTINAGQLKEINDEFIVKIGNSVVIEAT